MDRTLEAVNELGQAIQEIGRATVKLAIALDKNMEAVPMEIIDELDALTKTVNTTADVIEKLTACFKLDYLTDEKEIN